MRTDKHLRRSIPFCFVRLCEHCEQLPWLEEPLLLWCRSRFRSERNSYFAPTEATWGKGTGIGIS